MTGMCSPTYIEALLLCCMLKALQPGRDISRQHTCLQDKRIRRVARRCIVHGNLPPEPFFRLALHDLDIAVGARRTALAADRKSTRLNSSHTVISYAVFCLKKKKTR